MGQERNVKREENLRMSHKLNISSIVQYQGRQTMTGVPHVRHMTSAITGENNE